MKGDTQALSKAKILKSCKGRFSSENEINNADGSHLHIAIEETMFLGCADKSENVNAYILRECRAEHALS